MYTILHVLSSKIISCFFVILFPDRMYCKYVLLLLLLFFSKKHLNRVNRIIFPQNF